MRAPTARPNMIARSTAPRFMTGKTPGNAKSTAQAWLLGDAPKRIGAPLKIFDSVVSCACVSNPITTSHCIYSSRFFIWVTHLGTHLGKFLYSQRPLGKWTLNSEKSAREPHRAGQLG